MSSWVERKQDLEDFAHQFDRRIKLRTKDNWTQKVITTLAIIFTLGFARKWAKKYLEEFATTYGNYQFYPRDWEFLRVKGVIPHESGHTLQFKYFGLGIHPLLGLPLGGLVYLILPIPLGLAYGRFRLELHAEKHAWRYKLRQNELHHPILMERAEEFATTISSGMYGWAWPRKWTVKKFKEEAQKTWDEYTEEVRLRRYQIDLGE